MIILTPWKAKKIAIKVWEYFSEHPRTDNKNGISIRNINLFMFRCPLCSLYHDGGVSIECHKKGCPLKGCMITDSPYSKWTNACDYKARGEAAKEILAQIKAWKIPLSHIFKTRIIRKK